MQNIQNNTRNEKPIQEHCKPTILHTAVAEASEREKLFPLAFQWLQAGDRGRESRFSPQNRHPVHFQKPKRAVSSASKLIILCFFFWLILHVNMFPHSATEGLHRPGQRHVHGVLGPGFFHRHGRRKARHWRDFHPRGREEQPVAPPLRLPPDGQSHSLRKRGQPVAAQTGGGRSLTARVFHGTRHTPRSAVTRATLAAVHRKETQLH